MQGLRFTLLRDVRITPRGYRRRVVRHGKPIPIKIESVLGESPLEHSYNLLANGEKRSIIEGTGAVKRSFCV